MDDGGLVVRVECYAGYQGEETPRCLYLGPRRIRVEEVLDRWLARSTVISSCAVRMNKISNGFSLISDHFI